MTRAMRRFLHPRPAQQCQAVDSAWFGYGDAEEIPCRQPATHRVRVVEPLWTPGGTVVPSRGRYLLCAHHAAQHRPEVGPFGTYGPAYRYRQVAK